MQSDDELRAEHANYGNMVISEGLASDREFERLGYKFLGATKDHRGWEVHIFEIKPILTEITVDMILELARMTNEPLDTCHAYLKETNGNIVQASQLLRKHNENKT